MNEDIKEILDDLKYTAKKHTIQVLENGGKIEHCPQAIETELRLNTYSANLLLNYITNLQEENQKLKETNEEHRKINGDLRKENQELKEKVEQYENPDDYTLFYMWLDTRAKDKMKQMEHEVTSLKQHNAMITKLSENIKYENQKLVKVIDEIEKEIWKIRQLTFTKYNSNEWNNCLSFNDDILPIINKLTELKGGE